VGLIVVLVVGGRDVAAGTLQWQSLLGLLIAMMAVYGPIVSLLSVYSAIRSAIPTLDRVREIMQEQPDLPDAPDARPLPLAPRILELQDVGFAYRDRPVLQGLSARFEEGETIGIVGPSGAGKSTLLGLMLRFYDPTAGRILFDGVDLRRIRHADLMDRCAIVLQEPFLFIDTVANNIRFTRPTASMEEVIAAAKAANVHDEIVAMEHGYETIMGRHREGQGISVGQKQRICIAAALLKNAPILFLDEATSNLDSVSEHAVQGAIDRLMSGRTSFVIAHRLSTLRNATRLLVLDQGRMAGLGTHRELLAGCPTYQRLWSAQVGDRGATGESEPALRAVRP
jgi:ABC-type multidrug transport system fused ATPase/permease subunit